MILKFFVIFSVLVNLSILVSPPESGINKDNEKKNSNKNEALPNNPNPVKPVLEILVQPSASKNKTASNKPNSTSSNTNNELKPLSPKEKLDSIVSVVDDPNAEVFQSGALTRGVLVFVGLTFLFLLYAGFKTYRKRNRRSKRRTLVRRYGGKKYDVEMEPLPLSDEDDDTIFELNGTLSNNK